MMGFANQQLEISVGSAVRLWAVKSSTIKSIENEREPCTGFITETTDRSIKKNIGKHFDQGDRGAKRETDFPL